MIIVQNQDNELMQRAFNLMLYSLATSTLLCVFIIMLTVSFEATTRTLPELNHSDIIKLKKDLSNSNPFKHQRQGLKNVSIDEKAVNQGARIFLSNYENIPVDIQFYKGRADIFTSPSIQLPTLNLFFNTRLSILFENNELAPSNVLVGYLPIPDFITKVLYSSSKSFFSEKYPNYTKLLSNLEKVSFFEKKVSIHYRWDHRFAREAQKFSKNMLLSKEEQKLIAIYYQQLSKIPRFYLQKPSSVHSIIRPLFAHAKHRVSLGHDPVLENKAVLLTLGIFSSGIRINRLIKGENNKYLRHQHYGQLNLSGRSDLMRHFLISAALTVSTNKVLTDTIGTSKEINDAVGGSGFSFADLLADRAGVAFANYATNSDTASLFQEKVTSEEFSASDFMPLHQDLPESITASQFNQIYGDTKNDKYLLMEKEIKQRINALSIYAKL